MTRKMNYAGAITFLIRVLIGILVVPNLVFAGNDKLPSARKIFENYIKTTGGKNAYRKIENRQLKSKMEIVGNGIFIDITVTSQKPNLVRMLTKSAVTGTITSGCNGNVVWEISDMRGPLIKTGKERDNMLHLNTLDRFVYYKDVYKTIECTGVEKIGDKICYKVIVIPEIADPQVLYFDQESHLLIRLDTEIESAMGKIPVKSYFSDDREVDGILLPFKTRIHMLSQERISIIHDLQNNLNLPDDYFNMPEEIAEIVQN